MSIQRVAIKDFVSDQKGAPEGEKLNGDTD